jgi:hypothetical protein
VLPVREQLSAFYAKVCPRKLLETYEGNLTAVDRILQSYIELGCSDLAMDKLNEELRLKYGARMPLNNETPLLHLYAPARRLGYLWHTGNPGILTWAHQTPGCGLEIIADLVPPQNLPVVAFSGEASSAHAPIFSPSIDHASSNFPPRMQPSNGSQTPFASTETLSSMSRLQQQQQQQQQQHQWLQRSPRRHLPSATVLQIRSTDDGERGGNQLRGPSVQQSSMGGGKQPWDKDATPRMAWIGNRKMTVKVWHPPLEVVYFDNLESLPEPPSASPPLSSWCFSFSLFFFLSFYAAEFRPHADILLSCSAETSLPNP